MELLLTLLGSAILLGLIALYYHFTDPELIDEEEESNVESETPEDRARARLEHERRVMETQAEENRDQFTDGGH